jgi:hypothetical protein
VQDYYALTLFEIGTGGSGKNPTETGRMEDGRRCGDAIMIDFYRRGSLEKNVVVISGDRANYYTNNSSSYPVLVFQEKAMRLLD